MLANRVLKSKSWLLKTVLVTLEVLIIMTIIALYNIYCR